MNYYQTDGQVAILSGPHTERSVFIKNLTRCGNPELLDLRTYNLLPEVYPPIDFAAQRYTAQRTVVGDTVVVGYEDIPLVEIMSAAKDRVVAAVQEHLDLTAQTRFYDGILSLCSYATSTDPVFAAEGQAGVLWRDACWRACYDIMDDVLTGTRQLPTVEEVIAELPSIVW